MACLAGVPGTGWAPRAGVGLQKAGRVQRRRVTRLAADRLELLAAQANSTLGEDIPGAWFLHRPVVKRNPPPQATRGLRGGN